jgi:hypothetical protein
MEWMRKKFVWEEAIRTRERGHTTYDDGVPKGLLLCGKLSQFTKSNRVSTSIDISPVVVDSAFDLEEILRQRLEIFHVGRAGRTVVPNTRVVGALLKVHTFHKLRNDDIHVRVALTVRMRGKIQRHIVDEDGQIGSMIEAEATQIILIGLSAQSPKSESVDRSPKPKDSADAKRKWKGNAAAPDVDDSSPNCFAVAAFRSNDKADPFVYSCGAIDHSPSSIGGRTNPRRAELTPSEPE